MRKTISILAAAAAAAVPAAAVAARQPAPATPSKAKAPKVTYVLRGTLSAYTAANGSTAGSVTITVSSANFHGRALKGQSLTFAVNASTKVVLDADAQVTDGEKGIVKVRAPKRVAAAELAAALQAVGAAQVIDPADEPQD